MVGISEQSVVVQDQSGRGASSGICVPAFPGLGVDIREELCDRRGNGIHPAEGADHPRLGRRVALLLRGLLVYGLNAG